MRAGIGPPCSAYAVRCSAVPAEHSSSSLPDETVPSAITAASSLARQVSTMPDHVPGGGKVAESHA